MITVENFKQYVKDMSPEQKKVLTKYFCVSGCLGSLGAMKDADYDAMVDEKVKSLNLKQRALNKIGLDESEVSEIAPVNFYGWSKASDGKYCAKMGVDGEYRSSRYQVSYLFFSSTQVHLYSYTVDMLFNKTSETSEEYFYKDITNFTTVSESEEYKDAKGKTYTANESFFQIVVPGDKMRLAISGMNMEEVERSLQAMKQKLREKKM